MSIRTSITLKAVAEINVRLWSVADAVCCRGERGLGRVAVSNQHDVVRTAAELRLPGRKNDGSLDC